MTMAEGTIIPDGKRRERNVRLFGELSKNKDGKIHKHNRLQNTKGYVTGECITKHRQMQWRKQRN